MTVIQIFIEKDQNNCILQPSKNTHQNIITEYIFRRRKIPRNFGYVSKIDEKIDLKFANFLLLVPKPYQYGYLRSVASGLRPYHFGDLNYDSLDYIYPHTDGACH